MGASAAASMPRRPGVLTVRDDVPDDVRHGDFQFSMRLCAEAFGVIGALVAAPLVAIVEILHSDELLRKRFFPTVTDTDLDCLARNALRDKQSVGQGPGYTVSLGHTPLKTINGEGKNG